jgi:hypothetical protein
MLSHRVALDNSISRDLLSTLTAHPMSTNRAGSPEQPAMREGGSKQCGQHPIGSSGYCTQGLTLLRFTEQES